MTELEYVGNLKRIEDEVNILKRIFYDQHAVNDFGRLSFENEETLNQNAAFWNLHCHSCHVTAIMCLSRIFDSSGYSVHKLLIDSVDNLAFFSK